jgi:hypothetical protein
MMMGMNVTFVLNGITFQRAAEAFFDPFLVVVDADR